MSDSMLHQSLDALQAELAQMSDLSDQDRAKLAQLDGEIRAALSRSGGQPAGGLESASAGLQTAVEEFEAQHPRLTAALGRVAQALADMGI